MTEKNLLGMVEYLPPQMSVRRMKLKECIPQTGFVMCDSDDFPIIFPNPDSFQRRTIQCGMTVHILPHRFDPIAVRVVGSILLDEKITDAAVIFLPIVMTKFDGHDNFPQGSEISYSGLVTEKYKAFAASEYPLTSTLLN
jgi:hypothetical protein